MILLGAIFLPISYFQTATAIIWAVVAVRLVGVMLRCMQGRADRAEHWQCAMFFVALLLVAFPSRWLVLPADELTWKILYIIGIALAVYVLVLLWTQRKR